MKCNAGIWIDTKQLLEHTRRLVSAFNDFDREVFGKDLVRLNVAMIRDFALAYRLRDEHYVYDDSKVVRDIRINGNKREYLDRFIGAMIGYHPWQVESSLYPVEIDRFIMDNITPYYVRFVDDSVLVTDNKDMALAMIPAVREMCASIGITLHPQKFYCQPYQHGLEFLGYHILPDRVHINNRVVMRARAAVCDTRRSRADYVNSINSYLGLIKGSTDLHVARELLDRVGRKDIKKDYDNYKVQ